ncbi:MAG: hypothetical protein WD894_20240 [Pirellulales bacterium]
MNSIFADNSPPLAFDPSVVDDEALAELRRFSFTAMDRAVLFGAWLHRWCEHEELIRAGQKPRQADVHSLCMPPAGGWDDYAVGKSLEVVSRLTYCAADAAVGAFVDRLLLAIAGEAANRLIERKPDA